MLVHGSRKGIYLKVEVYMTNEIIVDKNNIEKVLWGTINGRQHH